MDAQSRASGRLPFHAVKWKEDQSVIDFVTAAWEYRPDEQERVELLGELSRAWFNGDQNLLCTRCQDRGYRLESIPNPNNRLRVVYNLFGPHAEQWFARLGLDALEPEAVPATGSAADLDATRLQTQVLRYYLHRLGLADLKEAGIRQLGFDGICFTKVTWDPLAGSEFAVSAAELHRWKVSQEILDRLADEVGDGAVRLGTGEVRAENVELQNITWGPAGVEFADAEWVVEARERSVSHIMDRWGLSPEQIARAYPQAAERWYRGLYDQAGSIVSRQRDPELVVTYELWAPRSAQHPDGLHAVVVGERVVNRRRNRELANPYQHGRVPYVAVKALPMPGTCYGKSPLWDMFDPQGMLNKLAGQMMESIELHANPRIWVQKNELIDEWELSSRPGGVHRYSVKPPQLIGGAELPSAMYAVFDRWIRVLQETIGIHDPSMGKAPAQGRSGRYVLALQDADNTRMGPTLKAVTGWMAAVCRQVLCTVRQFVSESRIISIRGADNAWERRAFRGAQLSPEGESSGPEAFNVVIRTSGQARTRAAQIELVTMLIQFGFYSKDNPEDVREVRRILELGDMSTRMDPAEPHRELQRRVHEVLLTGRYVRPEYYHHHDVRLAELRSFMNSEDFERANPQVRALFHRYEKDTIALQATHPLDVQAVTQDAVARFQKAQRTKQSLAAQLGELEAASAPGEQPHVAGFLRSPRAGVLANFLGPASQAG